ncbi:MAG: hypothetical protein ABH865_02555 [Candidatus Omnitrophota bacterium]|nr:hypothetical protein [Candidatus Omnitrophota bacterium]
MNRILLFLCAATFMILPASVAGIRDENLENGIREFLKYQTNDATGLVDSFINTTDELLVNQASTYDQALAGLAFLQLKEYHRAKQILLFFRNHWSDNGLCNFYDTDSGTCGVETTVHLSPNAWVGILALWYGRETGDESFYPFARDIGIWVTKLPRHRGGLAMGPVEDWGGPWPQVVSSENNLVAYALLRGLDERERDPAIQKRFIDERLGIIRFLYEEIIRRDGKGRLSEISVGYNVSKGGFAGRSL